MPRHTRTTTEEQSIRLERNRGVLRTQLEGGAAGRPDPSHHPSIALTLERFVVRVGDAEVVPYEGAFGIERLLRELARSYPEGSRWRDGHLIGIAGRLQLEGSDELVPLRVDVGAGGQLALTVGPSEHLATLSDVIAFFDRQFHVTSTALGLDLELLAQGYHPFARDPSEVVVVPIAAHTLLNAYLSHTGCFARDAMRCTAATRVQLPLSGNETTDARDYQLATALAPLLGFLTDNCLRARGALPTELPRMVRSVVWEQVDATRCGTVPGTFTEGFGIDAYERWVEGVTPILMITEEGLTFSTGSDRCRDLMAERDLTPREADHLLRMALPWARWNGLLELWSADALPPRQAISLAALVKGIFADEGSRAEAQALLGIDGLDDDQVSGAWPLLREQGWNARVYGRPVVQLAHELVAIADRHLADRDERRALDALGQLWEVRMVPRDTLVHNWERTHVQVRTREDEAVELWGEGAVLSYDELAGDPPLGDTSVMHLDQLRQDASRDA